MPQNSGCLYVIATPIGNLGDITARARDVLGKVEWVAVEDTRRTRQLLTHLGLRQRLISLHEHNEAERAAELIARLRSGEDGALVSDAGTPLISDPGFRLVAAARDMGLRVVPLPGPCAAIAALSVAGLPSDRFFFEGFLPARAGPRRRRLAALATVRETLIFYEAVHRIDASLADLADVLGGQRLAFLARELTKQHETFYRGSLRDIRSQVAADPAGGKGEMTLIVTGCEEPAGPGAAELARVYRLLAAELPPGKAARLAARITGATRAEAYRLASLPDPD